MPHPEFVRDYSLVLEWNHRFNWTPQNGMEGTILGTFKHPSGSSIYLMAFEYNDETLYVPIEMSAVAASR